jgi:pyruvate ferredoxin oxidoreductase beta subunit
MSIQMAVDTGIWPLKEAVHGDVIHSLVVRKRRPVEDYLKMQGRFERLFKPIRQEKVIRAAKTRRRLLEQHNKVILATRVCSP